MKRKREIKDLLLAALTTLLILLVIVTKSHRPLSSRSQSLFVTSHKVLSFMSSRTENKRRERSWERDDRDRYSRGGRGGSYRSEDRRRSSRSRSPHRGPDRDMDRDRRGGAGLSPNQNYILVLIDLIEKRDRDYRRDRPDDRRVDPRSERERDRRGDDRRRDRDDRREPARRDDRDGPVREDRKLREYESKGHASSKSELGPAG